MRQKVTVAALVVVLAVYLALALNRAVILLRTGDAVLLALGVAMVLLPVLGAWLIWLEIKFGRAAQRLADELYAEGGLPVDDLPRRPSGRVVREAADERFRERQAEVEADPDDWRRWFRLSLAYDDAGDRRRARHAARKAIALRNDLGDARTGHNQ
ncbi:hypothetical protein [Cryptosporangium sp. NPDC048952]|uniref:hypothetical protein n=1 Tax=Cryptosporangium sp. NPDC048952 TaxID=3363961 RepID=UPI003715E554